MKKKAFALIVACIMLLSISVTAFAEPTDGATLRHSIALIEVGLQASTGTWDPAQWGQDSRGTGFFVGKKGENPQYMITNRHVVEFYLSYSQGQGVAVTDESGNTVMLRPQIRVYFDYDRGDYLEASVVEAGDTESKDYAILKLEKPTSKRSALPIGIPTQEMSDPNKKVYCVGFPGAGTSEALRPTHLFREEDASIDTGTIVKLFKESSTLIPMIQISQVIHSGNSGGPLVYENGAAIGITTMSVNSSNASTPLYYAISMEPVKEALDRNNIPYYEVGESHNWLLYAILGVAILGVVVLLIVLLRRKPKPPVNPNPPVNNPPAAPKKSRLLTALNGQLNGKIYNLEKGKKLYIGRDTSRCKVLFKDGTPGVSNVHCVISFDGNTATIMDLGSTYGTTVNGSKLTPNQPQTLHRGQIIEIGSAQNRFVLK